MSRYAPLLIIFLSTTLPIGNTIRCYSGNAKTGNTLEDFATYDSDFGLCYVGSDGKQGFEPHGLRVNSSITTCYPGESNGKKCYCGTDLCNGRMPVDIEAKSPKVLRTCPSGILGNDGKPIVKGHESGTCRTYGACYRSTFSLIPSQLGNARGKQSAGCLITLGMRTGCYEHYDSEKTQGMLKNEWCLSQGETPTVSNNSV